jgi:hypothetical protein
VRAPVLLVIFNRPEHTRRALDAIRIAKPETLLIAADGPRSGAEAELCDQTREVIRQVDWPCTVLTDYSSKNLGCGVRVYTGIDWALTQFEEVIVLEDDCIPELSFFRFCDELLEHYRDDERVMHISGNNFQAREPSTTYSYYFSKYTHAWGWATWRRAWRHFDWAMKEWPELKKRGLVEGMCDDPYERRYWTEIFDRMSVGVRDVWDYQWTYSCWARSGLTILPAVNLVSNAGSGPDATHTKDESPYLNRPTREIGAISHPPHVHRDHRADAYTFANNFGGNAMTQADSLAARFRRGLRPVTLPWRAIKKIWRMAASRDPQRRS